MSEELRNEELEKVEEEVVESNYDDDYTTPTYEETGKKGNGAAEFVVAGLAITGAVSLATLGFNGAKWVYKKGKKIYSNMKTKSEEPDVEDLCDGDEVEETKELNSKKTK